MPVELVYETHSLSTDNEAGIATGWLPGRLSDEGRRLAEALGTRRRNDGIAVAFVSDLERALETARIAFEGSDVPVRVDERLRECNYGEWNGMPVARLAAERRLRIDTPFPGGESYRDVVERTRRVLRDVVREWDGKRVLVISHAANRWALQHLLHGVPLEELVDAPVEWQEGWEYEVP